MHVWCSCTSIIIFFHKILKMLLLISSRGDLWFSLPLKRLTVVCGMFVKEPEFTDKAVTANKEYQYRVTAENEGGESKPSEPSDLIKAKALKGWSLCFYWHAAIFLWCLLDVLTYWVSSLAVLTSCSLQQKNYRCRYYFWFCQCVSGVV